MILGVSRHYAAGRSAPNTFPDMKGLSATNLKYMKQFAQTCPGGKIGQQSADQLPWFHIVTLLTKLDTMELREWYAVQAINEGWSRDILQSQIKSQLHLRQGAAITNFAHRLLTPQAGLASEVLKDPYHFDFLGLGNEALERDIENAMIRHNTRLKCHVVVELKSTAFKPEHAGQLNFYLTTIDAQLKAPDDKPSIGLLLCKSKNKLVVEYALSDINKPIGVADYQLVSALPAPLDRSLPSIEELEAELSRDLGLEERT